MAATANANFDTSKDADVVVIGGGPGGYPCAIRVAQLGARVVVVENDNPGGTCLNWGCIPTKTMIGSVDALHTLRHAKDFGLTADNIGVDFPALMARKDKVVKTLVGGVGYLFKKHGVRLAEGIGSLVDANTVEVKKADGTTERITTNAIVVATGSVPSKLPIPGIAEADVYTANWEVKRKFKEGTLASGAIWTSNEAVSAKTIPAEMVVLGGGVIGAEFSYTYNGLGTKCTILEMQDRIIPTMDADLGAELEKILKKQGITIKTGVRVTKVEDKDGRKAVYYTSGKEGAEESVAADVVLVSTGRVAFTEGLNLEGVGVEMGASKGLRNAIKTNSHMQTNVPSVYAIGDVTGSGLAHTATAEGLVAAETICGHSQVMSYKAVPACIYTEPEVASVGLTEQEARDKGYDVKVGKFDFRKLGKAMAINQRDGFVKGGRRGQVRRDPGHPYHRPPCHRPDHGRRCLAPARKHGRGAHAHHPRAPDPGGSHRSGQRGCSRPRHRQRLTGTAV
jgi:dihydrolipoamide dehydrogenase